jgi:hypothetical protein
MELIGEIIMMGIAALVGYIVGRDRGQQVSEHRRERRELAMIGSNPSIVPHVAKPVSPPPPLAPERPQGGGEG